MSKPETTVPDGWKLVPFTPTEAMLSAAGYDNPFWDYKDTYRGRDEVAEVWERMIAATPEPPA